MARNLTGYLHAWKCLRLILWRLNSKKIFSSLTHIPEAPPEIRHFGRRYTRRIICASVFSSVVVKIRSVMDVTETRESSS